MSPELIKIGLERYASPQLNPIEMLTVHTDSKGHQTPLVWYEVAAAALQYFEQVELLCAAAAETSPGYFYLKVTQENRALQRDIAELKHMNKRQAEMLKAKEGL